MTATLARTSSMIIENTLQPARIQDTEVADSKPASIVTTPSVTGKKDGNALKRLFTSIKSTDGIRIAACCLQAGTAGWNDACAGALIPYMERFYHINFIEVSTLFVGAFIGFVTAGALNNVLTDRLGTGRILTMGALMQAIGYAVILAPPPFPLFPVTYALLIGFGIALQMSQTSSYLIGLPGSSIKINYTQAAYGLGAMLSPFCATALASSGVRFSYFFAVSLGLALTNALSMFLVFYRHPDFAAAKSRADTAAATASSVANDTQSLEMQTPGETPTTEETPILYSTADKNRAMLTNKTVWLSAIFLCLYVGAEVSIGGWVVSFLLRERGGEASVGYVSTGFWGGITLGRLVLPHLQARVGDSVCLYTFIILSLLLEFSVWFWRSLIGNAVAICLIGFLLSTFFAICLLRMTKLLPKHLHTGAIGLVAAAGQAGSAAFPFLTGALAQRFGPIALQPVVIGLLVGMAIVWTFIPSVSRRRE